MRTILSLAILGILAGAVPAFAQQQQQQSSYTYGSQRNNNPVYNSFSDYQDNPNRDGLYSQNVYNSGANRQILPLDQMVAGRNAPSYAYGGNQQRTQANLYGNGGGFGNMSGALSPDQARQLRSQRDANAQAYQQQYMDSLRQQQQNNPYPNPQMAGSQYQGSQFEQLYAENDEPKPVKRKVLYKQLKNPLKEPPRLFNTD